MKAREDWLQKVATALAADVKAGVPSELRVVLHSAHQDAETATASSVLARIAEALDAEFRIAESRDPEDVIGQASDDAIHWARAEARHTQAEIAFKTGREGVFAEFDDLITAALEKPDTLTAVATSLRKRSHDDDAKLSAVWAMATAIELKAELEPVGRLRIALATCRLTRGLEHLSTEGARAFNRQHDRLLRQIARRSVAHSENLAADIRRDLVKQVTDQKTLPMLARLAKEGRKALVDLLESDTKVSEEECDWAKLRLGEDLLDDKTFLLVCERRGFVEGAVKRRLTMDDVAGATECARTFATETEIHDTLPLFLAELLQTRGCSAEATIILEAFEERGPVADVATPLAALLLGASREDDAADVLMRRFQQRPSFPSYQAVIQLRPALRPRLLACLHESGVLRVAIDIAVEEGDLPLLKDVAQTAQEGDALHLWRSASVQLGKMGVAESVAQRVLPYARRHSADVEELERLEQIVPSSQRVRPIKSTPPEPGIDVGTKVHHKKFGDGVIVAIQDGGPDAIAEIEFEGGCKKLRLSFVTIDDS